MPVNTNVVIGSHRIRNYSGPATLEDGSPLHAENDKLKKVRAVPILERTTTVLVRSTRSGVHYWVSKWHWNRA